MAYSPHKSVSFRFEDQVSLHNRLVTILFLFVTWQLSHSTHLSGLSGSALSQDNLEIVYKQTHAYAISRNNQVLDRFNSIQLCIINLKS